MRKTWRSESSLKLETPVDFLINPGRWYIPEFMIWISACFVLCLPAGILSAQTALRPLEIEDFAIWNTIHDEAISASGRYVTYRLMPGEGDSQLRVYNTADGSTLSIDRVSRAQFEYGHDRVIGLISPDRDSLRVLERKKVEKKNWPSDTLFLLQEERPTTKIAYVTGYKTPAKAGDFIAYTLKSDALKKQTARTDSSKTSAKGKAKKDWELLVIRQLSTGREDTLYGVKEYEWSEKAPVLMAALESPDSLHTSGVMYWNKFQTTFIKKKKGKYGKLAPSPTGSQLAFLGYPDTTKMQVEPWELFYYDFRTDSATSIASKNRSPYPLVSEDAQPQWSDNEKYLFYGRAEMPVVPDTSLLADETVHVEVWSTDDPELYTMQKKNKKAEEDKSYTYAYDPEHKQHVPVTSLTWENAVFAPERKGRYVVVYTEKPYEKELTWVGDIRKDLAKTDLLTGAVIPIKKGLVTNPHVSPAGKFAYGYSDADGTWWACDLSTGKFSLMNKQGLPSFGNELNDAPGYPNSYGYAGWIADDQALIFYDRYDMWAWSPDKGNTPEKLTSGREQSMVYRYIKTSEEADDISPIEPWLILAKEDNLKTTGYTWFNPASLTLEPAVLSEYQHNRDVHKAKEADAYIFERESFETFPDIRLTTDHFSTSQQITDANPQQKNYRWGSIELYHWMDFDSVSRTGLLVKPFGFDSLHAYPTIVNFYERSSDELYNHPTPMAHRSTINYAYYASRGYVIFNPDVTYKVGAPGESAYEAVISGVTSLVRNRIADGENLALQGHSWGGYQVAYIVTRTNQFKCAEAGAAVVNMISAYGGIRGESGRARMFQYEQEQSRLGKSLWEDPQLYVANSPLFKVNKINTPLLLLHNDDDGAVPFSQGIEFYLALRRNGKKAWLLNYTGEPHWPTKPENRKDFQTKMSQFFDHYLKNAPMPEWMAKTQPVVEKVTGNG